MPHPWIGPPKMGGTPARCRQGTEVTKWSIGKRGRELKGTWGGHHHFFCGDPPVNLQLLGAVYKYLKQEDSCPLPPCNIVSDLFYSIGMQMIHMTGGCAKLYKWVMLGERRVWTFQTPDGALGSEPGFPEGLVESTSLVRLKLWKSPEPCHLCRMSL